jgi:hypothetical protein
VADRPALPYSLTDILDRGFARKARLFTDIADRPSQAAGSWPHSEGRPGVFDVLVSLGTWGAFFVFVRLLITMRVLLVIIIILSMIAEPADARKRRHHRHHGQSNAYAETEPVGSARGERRSNFAALIPRDWQLERADAGRPSNRFVSPAGTAWLAFYARSAEDETREERFKALAFADDGEITYLRGERDWLAVSGIRGDQIFYRKVVLACGERQWRHIALEYPAKEKRQFDRLVSRMSRALDRAREEDCRPPAPESTPSVKEESHL